ncbi:MAG: SPOR domain-containing protein [Myxococcales bacterium]|jgi:cell division septation protein DedD
METRMRDLDQIQERDGDDRGRRVGTILLATGAVVGLTFAMGVVVGRAAEPPEPPAKDPLAQLDRMHGASGTADGKTEQPQEDAPDVEPADLSFPQALTEEEDRPEVLAALRAAALEEAALANPGLAPEAVAQADAVAPAADPGTPSVAAEVAPEQLVAAVPAAVAAGSAGRTLPQDARHDPLVAEAIRAEKNDRPATRAPRGRDGEYTLQVISYDSPGPAEAFAEGLRAKGHEAFVVKADIPERGRYFRVRIGPFKNRFKAETYRRKFEQEERMNTFVVRKKPEA